MTQRSAPAGRARKRLGLSPGRLRAVEDELLAIEKGAGGGEIELHDGFSLKLSNLGKPYFPDAGITKGALMRYYTRMWPAIQPHVLDRPLVLKRYPEGISGPIFYQQNAGAHVPRGVRVEQVKTSEDPASDRIIGGDLLTLLYTVQLGAIEVHPWLTRTDCLEYADQCLIDLDPGDDVPYSHVVALARDILEIAAQCELGMAVKTSGSSGMHLVIPLPAKTSFATSGELAVMISRAATRLRPERATVERSIRKRPPGTIYVDAMQNSRGKSAACAYSVRPTPTAMVSTPLRSSELTTALKPQKFTLKTLPARLMRVGELWSQALAHRPSARMIKQAIAALEQVV